MQLISCKEFVDSLRHQDIARPASSAEQVVPPQVETLDAAPTEAQAEELPTDAADDILVEAAERVVQFQATPHDETEVPASAGPAGMDVDGTAGPAGPDQAALVPPDAQPMSPPSGAQSAASSNPQLPTPDSRSRSVDEHGPLAPSGVRVPANLLLPNFTAQIHAVIAGGALPDLPAPLMPGNPAGAAISPYFADDVGAGGGYFDVPAPAVPRAAVTPIAAPRPAVELRSPAPASSLASISSQPEAGPSRTAEARIQDEVDDQPKDESAAVAPMLPAPEAVFLEQDAHVEEPMDVSDHDSIASSRPDVPEVHVVTDEEEDKTMEQLDFSTPPPQSPADPAEGVPQAQAQEIVDEAAEELDALQSVAEDDQLTADAKLTPVEEQPELEALMQVSAKEETSGIATPLAAPLVVFPQPSVPAHTSNGSSRTSQASREPTDGDTSEKREHGALSSELPRKPEAVDEDSAEPELPDVPPGLLMGDDPADGYPDEDADGSDDDEYLAGQEVQDALAAGASAVASPTPPQRKSPTYVPSLLVSMLVLKLVDVALRPKRAQQAEKQLHRLIVIAPNLRQPGMRELRRTTRHSREHPLPLQYLPQQARH
jgi:hypothetical protein